METCKNRSTNHMPLLTRNDIRPRSTQKWIRNNNIFLGAKSIPFFWSEIHPA
jgi:hypothetical protein